SLARLHGHTNSTFGLDPASTAGRRDNYIGSLKQVNTGQVTWGEFFIHCRLEPQVKMAIDHQRIGMGDVLRFERLYGKLPSLFPIEPPALLHGDLWSGNFLCDAHHQPVLIDPAVYYGHREMDIAMTKLFGGFEPAFYSAYSDAWAMEIGWEERADLCNLYPLLVHVNLFGGSYAGQVAAILLRFA
ncbi:MAG: fructosamine kinase family protein, partial [Flavobacteriales bacterium]